MQPPSVFVMPNSTLKAFGLVLLLTLITFFYYNTHGVRALFNKSIIQEDHWAEARGNFTFSNNEQEEVREILHVNDVKEDAGRALSNESTITKTDILHVNDVKEDAGGALSNESTITKTDILHVNDVKEDAGGALSNESTITETDQVSNDTCFKTLRDNPSSVVQDMKRRLVNLTNVLHTPIVELLEEALATTTADLPSLLREIEIIEKPQRCSSCSENSSFPANLIGTKIRIPSCGHWNGLRLPVIAVAPIGRLGNVMGEYASIFALKELFDVSAVLTISHKKTLEEYFPRLSLPVVEMGPWGNWTGLPEESPFYPFYGGLQLAALGLLGSRLFVSSGYPFEMRLFNVHRDKIRQEFTFADLLVNKAQEFLSEAAANSVDIVPNKPISFVGVHIRRTDYMNHMASGFGKEVKVDYKQYIERAVHYYEAKYDNLVFIVASDDFEYSTTMFNSSGPRNVFFSNRSPSRNSSLASIPPSPKSAGEDMALLTQCNHSVITLGTFSFWTGYLNPGTVVYPDVKTPKLYPMSRPFYEDAKIEDFIPLDM